MEIDIGHLLEQTGKTLEEEGELDRAQQPLEGTESQLDSAVEFTFEIFHAGEGLLRVNGSYKVDLRIPCSRCLEPLDKQLAEEIHGMYVPADCQREVELEENQYRVEYSGIEIDPWELIRQDVLVKIPMRPLCSEDCEGLCTVCGENLNESDCEHEQQKIDPRLEKLQDIDVEN